MLPAHLLGELVCFTATLNGQKFLCIQVEFLFFFKLKYSQNVWVCALLFSFGLFVLWEIFEIIKKHLGHRQCLLSLNNSLLFSKIGDGYCSCN